MGWKRGIKHNQVRVENLYVIKMEGKIANI